MLYNVISFWTAWVPCGVRLSNISVSNPCITVWLTWHWSSNLLARQLSYITEAQYGAVAPWGVALIQRLVLHNTWCCKASFFSQSHSTDRRAVSGSVRLEVNVLQVRVQLSVASSAGVCTLAWLSWDQSYQLHHNRLVIFWHCWKLSVYLISPPVSTHPASHFYSERCNYT